MHGRSCPLFVAALPVLAPAHLLLLPQSGLARDCLTPAVYVHKGRGELLVTCGGRVRLRARVSFGARPVGHKQRSGDERTPEGQYKICIKQHSKRFYKFMGLSYPGLRDARSGLARKIITRAQYEAIARALRAGRCPPWRTVLGGAVGIHGVPASLNLLARAWHQVSRLTRLHRVYGFSDGCIATDNESIDRIWALVQVGTPVFIYPVGGR